MGIKSDTWIRRMATEHGMIEPFVEGQVGQGIISYGVSSYGYDLRVSNQFKIFTNVNSTYVDPKAFDPNSFVDFEGDICTVPPNSFALASSVEYFRIPDNVLAVCLGKCLTGDTRVVDAETGAYLPIQEFTGRKKTVALKRWSMTPATVSAFIPQGPKPVYELRTKSGLKIRATANHPFRQFHGWTPLSGLKPGDRIAVARQIPVFGRTPLPDWEAALLGLMISEGQCHTPGNSPTFTSADEVLVNLLKKSVEQGSLGTVTYKGSKYGYRLVNHQGRGSLPEHNRASRWLQSYGLDVKADQKFVPQAVFMAPKQAVKTFLCALFSGDGGVYRSGDSCYLEYYSNSRRLIEDVHHLLLRFGIFSLIREKQTHIGTTAYRIQITDHAQIERFAAEIGFWSGSIKAVRLEMEILPFMQRLTRKRRSNFDTLPQPAWKLLKDAASRNGRSLMSMGVKPSSEQSLPYATALQVAHALEEQELLALANGPVWDVVVEITPAGTEEVYDLTVPGLHNFVANDMIVHNSTYARCGIIVNVTPFEPGWEGYVTLEISNTTPLPCRIYANEGLCQVLFFEGDEPCETNYRNRAGKYQAQKGIVLPRILK